MKYKKTLLGATTLVICFMLAGCGHEHTWAEATCTEPKTCSECGKTEGEPLGHTWVEATCSEAKHCSVCGETEGEPFEHTWVEATCSEAKHCSVCGETEGEPLEHTLTEANYQQPATCQVCGATIGDVLTPAFEEHNVKGQFMEQGKTYDYVTCCYDNTDYKTIGQATITDYQTFASDDTHEAKEGYEWKTMEVQIAFSDDNACTYGMQIMDAGDDYYDIIGYDNSFEQDDNGICTFTVNYNGQDYTECTVSVKAGFTDWKNDTKTWIANYESLLPVGYDGSVIAFRDASISWEDGQYIFDVANDDTLFFRLN